MTPNLYKRIAHKFLRGNKLLYHLVKRQQVLGHPFKAAFLTFYLGAVRNLIHLDRTHRFILSPNYYSELHKLLHIAKVKDFELVRVGPANDGGYIMLDDFHGSKIAYSFGICDDVRWDKDMTSRGYDVFMYDHTIENLPEENSRFHWQKLGIIDGKTQDERLKTLEYLLEQNHHENEKNMILKMDVEGAEWGFLQSVSSDVLKQFDQITFELHNLINPENPELLLEALRKINKTHQLIHLHGNNFSDYINVGGKNFARAAEASYVLREKYNFSGNYDGELPLTIDNPDTDFLPEIISGLWNSDMTDDTFAEVKYP